MLNRIILIGRLTADPELRYTKNGVAVASFTLAVDRRFKNTEGERETDFIDVVVWRQQAESCSNYLSKGKLCAVDGSLQIRSYEAKDGTKRKAAEVVADDVRFLSPKDGGSAPQANTKESSPFNQSNDADMVGDDDLPF
jgi:single-strand DNA-binding protein